MYNEGKKIGIAYLEGKKTLYYLRFPQCMEYALKRFRSLNEFCVICDERHVLETGMIKVPVCMPSFCVD